MARWVRGVALLATACGTAPAPPSPAPTGGASRAPSIAMAPASAAIDAAPAPAAGGTTDPSTAHILTELAALRGRPFKRAVPWSSQTRAAFRKRMRAEIARETGGKREVMARVAHRTGFVPRPLDLADALERAATTQVLAYYDPKTGAFHVITGAQPKLEAQPEREVLAHELVHALQDQHFGLTAYLGGEGNSAGLGEDERMARHTVVEGEATFLAQAHGLAAGAEETRHLGPVRVAAVRMSVAMMAAMDMVDVLAIVRGTGAGAIRDEEARRQLAELARMPPLIVMSLVEPYLKGAHFVSEVWGRGGWAAVDALYADPPTSYEQILHPVQKFLDRRDPPIAIRLRAPPATSAASGEPVSTEVLGELSWRIYFKTWQHPDAEVAAAGWGGDASWAWQRKRHGAESGQILALTATRWDGAAEARRFCDAYVSTLPRRLPGARPLRRPPRPLAAALVRPDGTITAVDCRGLDVDIVDGATAAELVPLLDAAAAAERTPRAR